MRTAILTTSTPNRRSLYEITNRTKQKYADKFGIDFIFSDTFRDEIRWSGHLYWLKPLFLNRFLDQYDVLVWIDDDAGFVRYDEDVRTCVCQQKQPLLCGEDECGMNSGIVVLKNCDETKQFMDFWTKSATDPKWQRHLFDQDALIDYADSHAEVFGVLPATKFNAHHPSFKKGCPNDYVEGETLICHIAGGDYRKRELFRSGEIYRIFNN